MTTVSESSMEVEESGMSDCAVNDCEAEINTKSDEITSKIQSMPTMQKGPSRDKDTSSRYVMGKKKGNRTLRKLKRPFRSGLRTSTSDRFLHEESSVKKIVSLFATKPSYNEGSQFRKGKRELDLSNKNLNSSKISDMVAEGHCTVRKLNLSNCRLTYLPEALNSCFKLEELDLSHNPLNYPSPSCLPIQSLCNLKKLDLSDCHLTEIPFAFPPNLQELNLSHNNLDYQADLLEYLNRKKKSGKAVVSKSGKESEHMTRILELSKLKKLIIFEDNVYTKSRFGGVWTLKSHQEPVLFSKLMSTDRTSLQGEVKESGMPDWIVNDCQPCEEVTRLDEFCRIRKSDEITVETYRSMLQSLNIVCCLLNTNGETTLNRSCGKIFYELNDISGNDQFSHKMEGCRSNLQRGVSFLGRWSIRGDDHEFTLENSGKVFWNAFESARIPSVESLTMADQIISTKLRITSEILRNLALPSAAVLGCLNLLQELHDQQEVQTALSFVANGKAVSIHERAHFENVISIFKLNKILYDFTLTFAKSPPFAEDWPATIKLAERTYNPLTQKRWLKEQLEASSITMRLIGLIDIESQTQVIHDHAARYNGPVIESSGMSRNNSSITIGEAGGCFSIPIASGCLIFPPQDFDEPKTMEISRVRYEECEVKPKDGEVFVSRILEIKPKGVTFKKPVTVFISHSAYEDQIFLDFYELVIGRLNPAGWQELKTERISSIEDVPKEILNPEALEDYLPCAQATIQETCALVAVTRIRSEMIFVPTNRSYTFSKAYGNNAELRMTFPAGVTKEILCLKVQLIPVDTIVNTDAYRDQNLIRGPVIKVSGQKVPFLKPVEVELTYSHCDVANIDEDVLPVGTKTKMTAMYGFLLHKHKVTDSELRSEIINETNEVYIERQRKDQLRFFFSVQHFSDIQPVVSTTKRESYIPPMSISGATNINLQRYNAIVLAVHKTGCSPATLHAILAPREALKNIKDKWNVTNEYRKFEKPLRFREPVYFCVPWSNDNQLDHLPLENHTLRFDPDLELESELHNNTEEGINLKGKDMRFLQKECHDGKNHSTQGDCRAVAPIYTSSISSVQGVDRNVNATSPTFTQRQDDVENKILSTVNDTKIKSQKEGVDRNVNATSPTFTQRQDDAENKTLSTVNDAEIKSQKEDMKDNLHRCELFEEEIEKKFLEKLGINRGNIQNPIDGVTAKTLADAGAVSSIALGIAGGVTIILGISTFGVTSFALAAMTGVTFTVSKVNKRLKKSNAKKLNEKVKLYLHSHLKCIILDVAKELSRMFEYQVLRLKDEKQIEVLAECAVDLMLNLKRDDSFDRNTLLKKVLKDDRRRQKEGKKELLTRNDLKWSALDVFRKPGLRKIIFDANSAHFKYFTKPNGVCDPDIFGYRGQFLERKDYKKQTEGAGNENEAEKLTCLSRIKRRPKIKQRCKVVKFCNECSSNYENSTVGQYFGESAIDSEYTECRHELSNYHPIHILVQCPRILDSFVNNNSKEPSLAAFLKGMLDLPEHRIVRSVYRQHSPGSVPNLPKSDLTGSDFSHCNFSNSSLENCRIAKCVMLFTRFFGAKLSGSTFIDTLISHSNLCSVKADRCEWTRVSLLYSRVDNANLGSVVASIGGNCLNGTNMSDTCKRSKELNGNESSRSLVEPT